MKTIEFTVFIMFIVSMGLAICFAQSARAEATTAVEVAMIGCAHIHAPDFAKRLNNRPDVKVKYVWDADSALAEKYAKELHATVAKDVQQVLSDPSIKAIIICSQTVQHENLVTAAAKAKKDIYAEKPLGMGAKDAYAMAKAIDDAGVLFQTGYFMRGEPAVQFIKEQAQKGVFGKITRIRGCTVHSGALDGWFDGEYRWMADPKQAGVGALGDLGTHSLDLMLWIMNQPVTRVTAVTNKGTNRYGCDEYGEGLLVFQDGAIGSLAAGWDDAANPVTLEVAGTEGHATIVNGLLYFQSKHAPGADGRRPWTQLPPPQSHAFEHFLDAITGKKAALISADEAAYRCAVMDALYQGANGNKWADVAQPAGK